MFLKVSPMKGVMRFGKREKLTPRYIGSFEILNRIDNISYKLALPPNLNHIHPIFHISMLRKYIPHPSHAIPIQKVIIEEDLSYKKKPIAVLDRQVRKLRNKEISMIKVQWQRHNAEEST